MENSEARSEPHSFYGTELVGTILFSPIMHDVVHLYSLFVRKNFVQMTSSDGSSSIKLIPLKYYWTGTSWCSLNSVSSYSAVGKRGNAKR